MSVSKEDHDFITALKDHGLLLEEIQQLNRRPDLILEAVNAVQSILQDAEDQTCLEIELIDDEWVMLGENLEAQFLGVYSDDGVSLNLAYKDPEHNKQVWYVVDGTWQKYYGLNIRYIGDRRLQVRY